MPDATKPDLKGQTDRKAQSKKPAEKTDKK